MKNCAKCGIEKNESNAWKGTAYCKQCYNEWKKENRRKNKDKIADKRKTQWLNKNYRLCLNCGNKYVGKGLSRNYCNTKCKLLHNVLKNENECWEWKGELHPNGYAYTTNYEKRKKYHVHRVSYEIFKGEIPSGKYVCHHCDNKKCINPDHLWIGMQKENMQDAKKKGRLSHQKK